MPKNDPCDVICLGEAMGELSLAADGSARVAVGGDTLNTAIYLARSGIRAGFASMIGDDPFGQRIRALCLENQVDTTLLVQNDLRNTGLYAITTDPQGERSFTYWRDASAARQTLAKADETYLEALIAAPWLYLSGITLYVLQNDLPLLFDLLDRRAARGGKLAFDGNYRPRLWPDGPEYVRPLFATLYERSDLLLPTFDDEAALWSETTVDQTLTRLRGVSAATIVLKDGPAGCIISCPNQPQKSIPVPEKITPRDTTAAGDSFNAGFLANMLKNASLQEAALAAHRLAGKVIQYPGAIIDKQNMGFSVAKHLPQANRP